MLSAILPVLTYFAVILVSACPSETLAVVGRAQAVDSDAFSGVCRVEELPFSDVDAYVGDRASGVEEYEVSREKSSSCNDLTALVLKFCLVWKVDTFRAVDESGKSGAVNAMSG